MKSDPSITFEPQCNPPDGDPAGRSEPQCADRVCSESPNSNEPSSPTDYAKRNRIAITVIITSLILICMILWATFRPLSAGSDTPSPIDNADYSLAGTVRYVHTQSGSGLYMRSEPEVSGTVVAGIPDGRSVTVQKALGSWAYVTWDNYEGWCSMDYLLTEEEHTEKMAEFLNIPAIVVTETSPLRLREVPSRDGNTVESMPKGSQVIVLRMEDEWAYVDYQGISGWCASQYLELQE